MAIINRGKFIELTNEYENYIMQNVATDYELSKVHTTDSPCIENLERLCSEAQTFEENLNKIDCPPSYENTYDYLSSIKHSILISAAQFLGYKGAILSASEKTYNEYKTEYDGLVRSYEIVKGLFERFNRQAETARNSIKLLNSQLAAATSPYTATITDTSSLEGEISAAKTRLETATINANRAVDELESVVDEMKKVLLKGLVKG